MIDPAPGPSRTDDQERSTGDTTTGASGPDPAPQAAPPAGPRRRAQVSGALHRVGSAARRAPVTVALVVVGWTVGAVSGSLLDGPSTGLLAAVGAGVGPLHAGHWWMVFTAPLWSSGLAAYLGSTALVIVLLPPAEHRLGTVRAVAVGFLVQLVGTAAAFGVVAAVAAGGGRWADQLAASVAVGPGAAVVGTALVASAATPALWRRRLRVLLLIGLVMLALYSGLLSDVIRLCAGLVGLGTGAVWLGRPTPGPGRVRSSRPEARVLVALVVAASAVGPLIAAVAQTRVGPLSVLRFVFASPPPDALTVAQICADRTAAEECADLQARLRLSGIGPALMSVVPVLLLLVAAEGLRRGRHAAWLAGMWLNVALGGLGVLLAVNTAMTPAEQRVVLGTDTHLHPWLALALPVLQPLMVAVVLLVARRLFTARAPQGTYRRWTIRIAATWTVVAAVYAVGSVVVARQYDRPPGWGEVLIDLPTRFLPPGYLGEIEAGFLPVGPVATVLFEWTGVVFWAVVLVAGLSTFARTPPPPVRSDLARIRRLLVRTGGSSLAHLATWPGQSYWFIPDDDGPRGEGPGDEPPPDGAAVAYRVISGVAVSTGEPVGDPRYRERAVRGFVEHCQRQGWTPCLYSVGSAVADIATAMGWGVVQVAEETVLRLAGLKFTGKKWQDVRTALNRAGKAGITAEWVAYRDVPLAVTDQIRAISEEWVADRGLPEMEFTLGGLDELADDDVRLLIAIDGDRKVHGVTSWLPVRRGGQIVGWTLDFMRRRSDGFHGVMEFLIAAAAVHARDQGAEFLSLSGAPLARLDRGQPVAGLQRLLDTVGHSLEPLYGFRSLLAFKAKFQPEYRPLYLAYPDPAALAAIGNAIGRAYLPDITTRQATRLARRLVMSRSSPGTGLGERARSAGR